MASIEEVVEEWKKDSVIDEASLNRELIKTAMLHSKYIEHYVFFKAKLSQAEKKHNKLMYVKKKYYRGEMTQAELQQHGWLQYQGLKMSMSEFNSMSTMDPDLLETQEKISAYKTAVSVTEYIMKSIGSRDYSLKSVIEYNKFLSGA